MYKECPADVVHKRMYKGSPEIVQRIPEDVQRAPRRPPEGIQRGPKDLQRMDWGCIDNAYIGMGRNHNDSDLRCCCADR